MTLVPLHVLGGAIAIVSGLVALYAVKGARLHRRSGTIFVYAMLLMSRLIPFVVLVTMVYWLWRFRRKGTSRRMIGVTAPEAI